MESEARLGRKVSGRILERAGELRNEGAHTLGRLVVVLRGKRGMSREQLGRRTRLDPQWVMMLEQGLLGIDDLSRARLGRLGRAVGVQSPHPGIFLAEASGIDYTQLLERARPIKLGVRITR